MNKYRTHNCSELNETDVKKLFCYLVGFTENEITEIFYL